MTSPIVKNCVACGLNVSQLKRVKTTDGDYYCHPCWQARATVHDGTAAVTTRPNSSKKSELPASGSMSFIASGPATATAHTNAASATQNGAEPSMSKSSTPLPFNWKKFKSILNANLAPDLAEHPFLRRLLAAWFVTLAFAGLLFQLAWPSFFDGGPAGMAVSFAIIVTSVGIGIDAAMHHISIKVSEPYDHINNGWLRWCGGALWLWIIVAPCYLFRRLNLAKPAGQPTVSPSASADLETELRQLKVLVSQGILTEEEFAARKRTLLGMFTP